MRRGRPEAEPENQERWSPMVSVLVILLLLQQVASLVAYPLDGYQWTGIRRLAAYQLIQEGKLAGNFKLPPGALLPGKEIRLRLEEAGRTFDLSPAVTIDPALQDGLVKIIGARDPSYRVAVLDITDPENPRYAAIRGNEGYIPGSVGKLLVMAGLFNELRKLFPSRPDARADLLRTVRVTADRFAMPNSHSVPVVDEGMTAVEHRSIRLGDTFTLWEWVDHMVSPSSNAAGSVVWKQVLLLSAFGRDYPPSPVQEEEFFRTTPRQELTRRSVRLLEEPLQAAGLKLEDLRLGTYFTSGASQVVPGSGSLATPNQLLRFLIRLEQGRLVDSWSSLEMKKLMYFTRRRYRFAASPALASAAVFFKSGSLFKCRPEPDYRCGQYRGNEMNLMHSVAVVESPAGDQSPRVYLISMMSNVLKVNSAQEHLEIATALEGLIREQNR